MPKFEGVFPIADAVEVELTYGIRHLSVDLTNKSIHAVVAPYKKDGESLDTDSEASVQLDPSIFVAFESFLPQLFVAIQGSRGFSFRGRQVDTQASKVLLEVEGKDG